MLLGNGGADFARVGVVFLGGASFGVAFVVVRALIADATRQEAFLYRLLVCIHGAVVLFVAGTLSEFIERPLTWRTPAAAAIFSAKLVAMLVARHVVTERRHTLHPPQRRRGDEPGIRERRATRDPPPPTTLNARSQR
jgi:uncharacterized membrane-anchored protein